MNLFDEVYENDFSGKGNNQGGKNLVQGSFQIADPIPGILKGSGGGGNGGGKYTDDFVRTALADKVNGPSSYEKGLAKTAKWSGIGVAGVGLVAATVGGLMLLHIALNGKKAKDLDRVANYVPPTPFKKPQQGPVQKSGDFSQIEYAEKKVHPLYGTVYYDFSSHDDYMKSLDSNKKVTFPLPWKKEISTLVRREPLPQVTQNKIKKLLDLLQKEKDPDKAKLLVTGILDKARMPQGRARKYLAKFLLRKVSKIRHLRYEKDMSEQDFGVLSSMANAGKAVKTAEKVGKQIKKSPLAQEAAKKSKDIAEKAKKLAMDKEKLAKVKEAAKKAKEIAKTQGKNIVGGIKKAASAVTGKNFDEGVEILLADFSEEDTINILADMISEEG